MELHGGQDINLSIPLIDDYSVTTNFLGPSKLGLESIKNNLEDINHYPNQLQEPFKTNFINWLYKDIDYKPNFLFGNGASELIDLVIRIFGNNKNNDSSWKPGSSTVQYIEYERVCENYKYTKTTYKDKNSDITCIINPCNPTGEYKNINELKQWIEDYTKQDSLVIVDESMQPWYGSDFRSDSLVSQYKWIENMYNKFNIKIFIIHSWTKFFSCTGLRIGTLICPNLTCYELIIKNQIPWSCNILALNYINAVINDNEYIENTWNQTKIIREEMINKISKLYPNWIIYGEQFLSWIWINTLDNSFAKLLYDHCKFNGVPIRLGINGYKLPSYIRIAVRNSNSNIKLFKVLEELKLFYKNEFKYYHLNIKNDIVIGFDKIDINLIKIHEEYIENRSNKLFNYLESLENQRVIPAIIIDANTNVLIDGHHRLTIFKKLNIKQIPVLKINYSHPNIIVNPNNNLTTNDIINSAESGNLLKPKSSQHMIIDDFGNMYPIIVLSPMIDILKY